MRCLAALFRKIAQRIDPQPEAIEFYTTDELAGEIFKRNDVCLLFCAKETTDGDTFVLDGVTLYRMRECHIDTVTRATRKRLRAEFRNK